MRCKNTAIHFVMQLDTVANLQITHLDAFQEDAIHFLMHLDAVANLKKKKSRNGDTLGPVELNV